MQQNPNLQPSMAFRPGSGVQKEAHASVSCHPVYVKLLDYPTFKSQKYYKPLNIIF